VKPLSHRWKIGIAFCVGCITAFSISYGTSNPFTADITSEVLDARSNGVIETQEKEIARLRSVIVELSQKYDFPLDSINTVEQKNECSSHDDCQSIAQVCKDNACTDLVDPVCTCNSTETSTFVQCISENGEGNEARTMLCENGCASDPAPHCV
jgi:hypothetical protein